MAHVRLQGVTKRFGEFVAVHPLDLEIQNGDFLAILGPSGCGKTTLLRMIGGFERPSGGKIEIGGKDVTYVPPESRPTNLVFQGYGLFPHMNVRQNVGYGLRLRKTPADELRSKVDEILRLVHLENFAERPVQQLSGGQQQRVALARALVLKPAVLLLDEPLGALDLKLRKAMQDELRRLHRTIGGTFVFVTHDQEEALGLASHIAVMEAGRVVQYGDPEEIYKHPKTRFVSTFLGDANVLDGQRRGGEVRLNAGAVLAAPGPDGAVSLVLRPEAIETSANGRMSGEVVDRVFLGAFTRLLVRLDDGSEIQVHRPEPQEAPLPEPGARVGLTWRDEDARLLDAT
ncbi:MAG: ABC transporter ATP-binding protein [Geminicoccaceae bacterium]